MADREAVFHVTIPAGTPATNPLTSPLVWAPGYVRAIHVTIPDGHAGLTGYAIGYAGQQVVPDETGTYIISNDEKITHEFAVTYIGQQWTLIGYNTDVYDHTFHLRAEIDETPTPAQPPVLPALIEPDATPPAAISDSGDLALPNDQLAIDNDIALTASATP